MTLFFGEPELFAIELGRVAAPAFQNESQRGATYYWVSGRRVAGGEAHLEDLRFSMGRIVSDCGSRKMHAICDFSPQTAFQTLDAKILGYPVSANDLFAELPGDCLRFSLWFHHILGGKQFFLVDCGESARLIFGDSRGSFEGMVVAPISTFETVIESAYKHLEKLLGT